MTRTFESKPAEREDNLPDAGPEIPERKITMTLTPEARGDHDHAEVDERLRGVLREVQDLCAKRGAAISGCGCHGSPWMEDIASGRKLDMPHE